MTTAQPLTGVTGRTKEIEVLRKVHLLEKLPYFGDASEEALVRLARNTILRRFSRGTTILRAGARQDCAFLVTGRAKCTIPRGVMASELLVGIHEAGEMLTDCCANEIAAADVVALERSSVVFVTRRPFLAFLESHAGVTLRVLEATSERLRSLMLNASRNSGLEIADRLYRKLVDLGRSRSRIDGDGALWIDHGLHQSELAASIGASRESVNRQLALWRDAGFIETGRRYIVVRDTPGLAASISPGARFPSFDE